MPTNNKWTSVINENIVILVLRKKRETTLFDVTPNHIDMDVCQFWWCTTFSGN